MKKHLFAVLAILLFCLGRISLAESSASSSGTNMGLLDGYSDTTSSDILSNNASITAALKSYNDTAAQLLADMNKVKDWGNTCTAFGGRIGKAVDSANSTLKSDVDLVNSKMQPLLVSLQGSTVPLRAPASADGVAVCMATFQAGADQMGAVLTSLTDTENTLQSPVAGDLVTAQKNLDANDKNIRMVLSPASSNIDIFEPGGCPPQAIADYNRSKVDFSALKTYFAGLQRGLMGASSLITAKRGAMMSQRAICTGQ